MKPTFYIGEDGWSYRSPITDDQCIYKALLNSVDLSGLDKRQVQRLVDEYKTKLNHA